MFNIISALFLFVVGAFTLLMQLWYPLHGQMLTLDGVVVYLASVVCCIGSLALYSMAYRDYKLSKLQTKKFGQTR